MRDLDRFSKIQSHLITFSLAELYYELSSGQFLI